jgi:hypothetical protein
VDDGIAICPDKILGRLASGDASCGGDGKIRAVELLIAVKPDPDSALSRETVPDVGARCDRSNAR